MRRSLLGFLLAVRLIAQAPPADLAAEDKAWIASSIYAAIQLYFAHADGAPQFDLDRDYRDYLRQAFHAKDRRAFSLASIAFLGKLRNGHSGFYDQWLMKNHGQPLGFDLAPMAEGWVVVTSYLPAIDPGDIVVTVDGKPIDQFYASLDPLLEGSSLPARRRTFSGHTHLWPDQFELGLANGKRIRIDRRTQQLSQPRPFPTAALPAPAGVGYIRIRSFGDPSNEKRALEQLKTLAASRAIVFDVRGNGGGGTPSQLLQALLDRPWRDFSYITPVAIGHAGAQNQVRRVFPKIDADPYTRGYLDAYDEFRAIRLLTPGPMHLPAKDAWTGRIIVVTDGYCNSACEDFVGPLKTSGRATVVGEPTNGSSGQPYMADLGNGMMFRVSSKRYYLPDGSPFEGVGLTPDVEIKPTVAELKAGHDPALAKAYQLAAAN